MTDRPAAPSSRPAKRSCSWPGCTAGVPARLWGCTRHWNRLPAPIRKAISRAYRPGQELGGKGPSPEYVEAARAAQTWVLSGRLPSGRSELEPDELPGAPAPPSGPVDPLPPDLSASAAIFDRLEAAAAPPRDCSAPCDVRFDRPVNFGGLVPPRALDPLREFGPETVLPRSSSLDGPRLPVVSIPPPPGSFDPPRRIPLGGPIINEEHVARFELRRQPAELPEDLDPDAPGLSPIQRIRRRRNIETVRDRMAAKIREAHDRTMGKLASELFRQTIGARPVDPRGLDELGPRDVEADVLDREAAELVPFLGDPERWLPRTLEPERLPHPAELEAEAASILSADDERRRRAYVLGEFVTRTPEELEAEERERRRRRLRDALELSPAELERWQRPPIPLAELATSPPLGVCAVCKRTAPLVDSECPDCRH